MRLSQYFSITHFKISGDKIIQDISKGMGNYLFMKKDFFVINISMKCSPRKFIGA
jgi:hypothetical protein